MAAAQAAPTATRANANAKNKRRPKVTTAPVVILAAQTAAEAAAAANAALLIAEEEDWKQSLTSRLGNIIPATDRSTGTGARKQTETS